jgi:NADH dehydrogenase
MLEHLPGKLMTRDNYRSMQVPNTCDAPFPFRLQPQALEAVAPTYLGHAGPRERYPQLRWRARR